MGRTPCCEKIGLKRGRWTAEEDELLLKYIAEHGEGSWRSLPKNAGLLRCGKSCRLRWINYLRAGLKRGSITKEEEEIIIKLQASFGNRWSLIAGHLPGRTDNEIKNYWNSHLSRRIHTFKFGSADIPVLVDLDKLAAGSKRRGGRTSRSAMKKNDAPTSEALKKTTTINKKVVVAEKEAAPAMVAEQSRNELDGLDLDCFDEVMLQSGLGLELCPNSQVQSGLEEGPAQVESGAMSSSEEREHVGQKENGEEVVGAGEEEVRSWQMDMEGMEVSKLWDQATELWESGNGEVEFQGMKSDGFQEECFASWLFADIFYDIS